MPRGRPFVKGAPRPEGAGRVAGVPNKTTAMVKEMIEDAALEIGGLSALVKWITKTPKNEYAFWTAIFPRLLPLQVRGPGERGELLVKTELTMEELRRALQARGLPVSVFGADIPVLEEAEKVNGS
jgi:hypothetical protein